MQISHLITRPCTILRRLSTGTEDPYGNVIPDEDTVSTVCELQKRLRAATEEPAGHGELSDTLWAIFFPAGTTVGTGDVVTVDGQDYEMVGDPWHVRHPRTGAASHLEATVRRTA